MIPTTRGNSEERDESNESEPPSADMLVAPQSDPVEHLSPALDTVNSDVLDILVDIFNLRQLTPPDQMSDCDNEHNGLLNIPNLDSLLESNSQSSDAMTSTSGKFQVPCQGPPASGDQTSVSNATQRRTLYVSQTTLTPSNAAGQNLSPSYSVSPTGPAVSTTTQRPALSVSQTSLTVSNRTGQTQRATASVCPTASRQGKHPVRSVSHPESADCNQWPQSVAPASSLDVFHSKPMRQPHGVQQPLKRKCPFGAQAGEHQHETRAQQRPLQSSSPSSTTFPTSRHHDPSRHVTHYGQPPQRPVSSCRGVQQTEVIRQTASRQRLPASPSPQQHQHLSQPHVRQTPEHARQTPEHARQTPDHARQTPPDHARQTPPDHARQTPPNQISHEGAAAYSAQSSATVKRSLSSPSKGEIGHPLTGTRLHTTSPVSPAVTSTAQATATAATTVTNDKDGHAARNHETVEQLPDSTEVGTAVRLYQFLLEELERDQPPEGGRILEWVDRPKGVFKVVRKDEVARQWGRAKNNTSMTYEKFSRSLRYYYKVKQLERVPGQHLVYRFTKNAHPDVWERVNPSMLSAYPAVTAHSPASSESQSSPLSVPQSHALPPSKSLSSFKTQSPSCSSSLSDPTEGPSQRSASQSPPLSKSHSPSLDMFERSVVPKATISTVSRSTSTYKPAPQVPCSTSHSLQSMGFAVQPCQPGVSRTGVTSAMSPQVTGLQTGTTGRREGEAGSCKELLETAGLAVCQFSRPARADTGTNMVPGSCDVSPIPRIPAGHPDPSRQYDPFDLLCDSPPSLPDMRTHANPPKCDMTGPAVVPTSIPGPCAPDFQPSQGAFCKHPSMTSERRCSGQRYMVPASAGPVSQQPAFPPDMRRPYSCPTTSEISIGPSVLHTAGHLHSTTPNSTTSVPSTSSRSEMLRPPIRQIVSNNSNTAVTSDQSGGSSLPVGTMASSCHFGPGAVHRPHWSPQSLHAGHNVTRKRLRHNTVPCSATQNLYSCAPENPSTESKRLRCDNNSKILSRLLDDNAEAASFPSRGIARQTSSSLQNIAFHPRASVLQVPSTTSGQISRVHTKTDARWNTAQGMTCSATCVPTMQSQPSQSPANRNILDDARKCIMNDARSDVMNDVSQRWDEQRSENESRRAMSPDVDPSEFNRYLQPHLR